MDIKARQESCKDNEILSCNTTFLHLWLGFNEKSCCTSTDQTFSGATATCRPCHAFCTFNYFSFSRLNSSLPSFFLPFLPTQFSPCGHYHSSGTYLPTLLFATFLNSRSLTLSMDAFQMSALLCAFFFFFRAPVAPSLSLLFPVLFPCPSLFPLFSFHFSFPSSFPKPLTTPASRYHVTLARPTFPRKPLGDFSCCEDGLFPSHILSLSLLFPPLLSLSISLSLLSLLTNDCKSEFFIIFFTFIRRTFCKGRFSLSRYFITFLFNFIW